MDETETTVTHEETRTKVRSSAAFILTGLSGGHGVFHWFTQSFLVMLPDVKATFGLSPVQVGAISATREVVSGLVTLPGGIISDVLRRYWGAVLALCMGGFGLGWLLMGLSPVYPILLVGMAIVSMFASIWHLPALASLSHHFSHRRGAALSVHGIGGNIGDVLGPVLTGFLLTGMAWRGVLSMYAVVPLLLVFVVFWGFRDIGKQGSSGVSKENLQGQIKLAKGLLKDIQLWGVTFVAGLRGMAYLALITFLPLYMSDELGFSSRALGFHVALLVLVGLIATPTLGYLSDRLGRKKILVPSLLSLCGLSLLLVPFGEGATFTIIIFLMGLFLYGDQPILTAAALDMVGHEVATTALGLFSFSRFVMSAVSPLIAGYLYQTDGIEAAFYYAAGLFAIAGMALLAVRFRTKDSVLRSPLAGHHH